MLLNNDCSHDTRVLREAEFLAKAGYDVVILALITNKSHPDLKKIEKIDGFSIIRLKKNNLPITGFTDMLLLWSRVRLFKFFAWMENHMKISILSEKKMLKLLTG
jgi:hypothetical protein